MKPTSNLTPPDFGRLCYREPGEPRDGRYALLIRPFWRSEEEREAYESAVRNNPREVDVAADQIESSMAYIRRIASIAQQSILSPPLKSFPPAPRMNREYGGPRETITEGGLTFDEGNNREPGSDDE